MHFQPSLVIVEDDGSYPPHEIFYVIKEYYELKHSLHAVNVVFERAVCWFECVENSQIRMAWQ